MIGFKGSALDSCGALTLGGVVMKIYRRRSGAAGYQDAKKKVTSRIVKRLARGNVKTQNGHSTSQERLLKKSRDADKHMMRTKALVEAGA